MSSSTASTILAPLAAASVALALTGAPAAATEGSASSVAGPGSAPSALRGQQEWTQDPSEPAPDGVVRQSAAATAAEQERVLAYWTPERMAAARPLADTADGVPAQAGQPGTALRAPARAPAEPQADSRGRPWALGGAVTRTTGKVYLTMAGRDFTCSASVIDADNRSTVITAGHCAKDGTGPWARNWTFVPGYADGAQPYGRYTARELLVPPRWSRQGDDSHDYGMAVLNRAGGRAVQDRVGAQRIRFGDTAGQRVHAFGYPAIRPFDGRRLHYCSGTTRPDRGGTTANGLRCSMTQGSSGGPWFTGFDPAKGRGTVSSVVSFKYSQNRGVQYGPRLGPEAEKLYDRARRL